MLRVRFLFVAFSLALGIATSAQAVPIKLHLTFTVESTLFFGTPYGNSPDQFLSPPSIGSQYYGALVIDDAVVATDGPIVAGEVLGFTAQIGQTVWNIGSLATPTAFPDKYGGNGLRGPCYNDGRLLCTTEEWAIWGLGSSSLGFEVTNGEVTNIFGGIVGLGDIPFIDINTITPGFWTLPEFYIRPEMVPSGTVGPSYGLIGMSGLLTISKVPEPASLALLCIGLAGLIFIRRHTT